MNLLKLSTGQPNNNAFFGVHENRLYHKSNCVIMRLFTIDIQQKIILGAMTWLCYIENHNSEARYN